MAQAGIPAWGGCHWQQLPPVLPVGSRRRLPARPESVLVCLFPYFVPGVPRGNLARYAALPDYHAVAGRMLSRAAGLLAGQFGGAAFVPFVDASPLREVAAAGAAGLGERGLGGQLLTRQWGPYVFVGELVSDLPLAQMGVAPLPPQQGLCTGCGACLAACPTGALGREGVDLGRCRSHISQKKGQLTAWEAGQLAAGGLAWGCDCCTDACPLARQAQPTPIRAFWEDVQPWLTEENLPRLLQNRAFAWRGEGVLRRNLQLLGQGGGASPGCAR